jgi:hypothetical protein
MKNSRFPVLWWIGLFAMAMGYMESAVVVYLRTVFYPDGFSFPLRALSPEIGVTELFREAATIIMLVSIGVIASKKSMIRFALFIYAFAIWDIFYYIFLYLLIGWPSSLLEWDILFLIPVAWTGPVIAPVINSLTMILLAVIIIYAEHRTENPGLTAFEWSLLISGSVITIISYTLDYTQYIIQAPSPVETVRRLQYVPRHFYWWLFAPGEVLFFIAMTSYWRRMKKRQI